MKLKTEESYWPKWRQSWQCMVCSCGVVVSYQASIWSCAIFNKMSLSPLLIISLEAINNVVISLEILVLCSSTRAYPFAKLAIAFARYIMYVKDLLHALGLPETPDFLQEAIWDKPPTNTTPSLARIPSKSGAVTCGRVMYSRSPTISSSSYADIGRELGRWSNCNSNTQSLTVTFFFATWSTLVYTTF